MKRLVRSAVDPLPGSFSLRSLALLVGMLLAGVGVSVREYVQSGRPTARSADAAVSRGEDRRTGSVRCGAPNALPSCEPASGRGPCSTEAPTGSASRATPAAPASSARSDEVTQWTPEVEPAGERASAPDGRRVGSTSDL